LRAFEVTAKFGQKLKHQQIYLIFQKFKNCFAHIFVFCLPMLKIEIYMDF